jgi:acid stress-induced BolA-like protein IbaG/YrbA
MRIDLILAIDKTGFSVYQLLKERVRTLRLEPEGEKIHFQKAVIGKGFADYQRERT